MLEYVVRLIGPGLADGYIPGPVVGPLFQVLDRSIKGAVRLALEGRSTAGGPLPQWLARAADFDLVGTSSRAALRLQARTLEKALPERFGQAELFPDPHAEKSALTLLSESLDDALHGRAESEAYDDRLLGTFGEFGQVLTHGVDAVEIRNGRPSTPTVRIDEPGLRTVERLHRALPAPRPVRLAGTLNTIRYSDRAFQLLLPGGRKIRGVLTDNAPGVLAPLFGQPAVVSGLAHFRPSGSLLRVDAARIALASDADLAIWSEAPDSSNTELDLRALRQSQGPRSGISAAIGSWQDDASDEEIFRLLDEIS